MFTRQICFVVVLTITALTSGAFAADNTELLRHLEAGAIESGSDHLTVIENGRVLYSNRFGQTEKVQSVQSITKSVCALAIGVLLDRGAIRTIEEPMSAWIPAWKSHPEKSKITLRMILSHTSGLPNDAELGNARDRIEYAIQRDLVAAPGEKFIYSNVGSALFQHVIASASGQSVESFVDQFLFLPLGITDRSWYKDELGHEGTGGGLSMRPSDLIKIGEMMLASGLYAGKQVVSALTHQLILKKSQTLVDYGLLWWLKLPKRPSASEFRAYTAAGWGGQYITVFPEKNLIAVRTRDPFTIDENNEEQQSFGTFIDLVTRWQ